MASNGILQPKLYVLQYNYVADSLEKREAHFEAHLALIDKQTKIGNVVFSWWSW
jgi:uncharacterized protein YciI